MSSRRHEQDAVVLVSWVSVGHRASPLLTVIDDRGSPFRAQVRRVYLCWRDAPAPDGDREREALRATVTDLRATLEPVCPTITKVPWKTTKSPTDHAALRPFAEQVLKRARDENPDAHVVIHLSPGTPAMHAVWLVLGTTGFIEGRVSLIQTADDRGRAAGQAAVQIVRLDIDTWLRRFRAGKPRGGAAEDDGQMWDPARIQSPPLRAALKRLEEWAPLRVPVLLLGERGTGKTTMAHFLRSMSPFQKEQQAGWPVVVCGQFRVNQELARSELFGHVRGAFTGASRDRAGLLEQADGDTLFLDEIADIDHGTQRLLMAAVEGRGFHRVGEQTLRHSSFRLVSATNRPLEELRDGILDEDFYDRIAVFVLHVPALRQCREDLPALWRRVLTRATRSSGVRPDGWEEFLEHSEIQDALYRHPLSGNFRDLQRAAFHLLAALFAGRPEQEIVTAATQALGASVGPTRLLPSLEVFRGLLPLEQGHRPWEEYERRWLRAAMEEAGGNKSEAARLLDLPRKTFDHRWKNLGGDD
jgi:DNA-binding NtrC family response regulator